MHLLKMYHQMSPMMFLLPLQRLEAKLIALICLNGMIKAIQKDQSLILLGSPNCTLKIRSFLNPEICVAGNEERIFLIRPGA